MSVNLSKGQGVATKRDGARLTLVRMGLGWDPVKKRGLFGSREQDRPRRLGRDVRRRQPVDAVFFNHLRSNDGSVRHTGDNLHRRG